MYTPIENPFAPRHPSDHERTRIDRFWVEHQPFLLSRGYRLRARYQPEWIPSWKTFTEDLVPIWFSCVVDATRVHDHYKVAIKVVRTSSDEIPIVQYLASEPRKSDPRNRSVPILDILPLPENDLEALIVMPMLLGFNLLPFRRVGEFTEALHQYLQARTAGLEFMHDHNIAHRDACLLNLMMDASKAIPKGFHFANWRTHDGVNMRKFQWRDRWSVKPVQYYFIDFGLSCRYPAGLKNIRDRGIFGQDRYDPFKLDIYQLGNAIIKVAEKYEGLEPFVDLGKAMTRQDPQDRPDASHAFRLLESLINESEPKRRVWLQVQSKWQRFRIQYFGANLIPFLYDFRDFSY